MPISNRKKPSPNFVSAITRLPQLKQSLLFSLLLLSFLYPGQNKLQTTIIHPGPVIPVRGSVLSAADYPLSDSTPPPAITAHSIIIQDISSKSLLYSRDPDTPLLPASTTKLMTALIALDTYQLGDTLTVKQEDHAVGHTMHLVQGETITVESLLYGLLVESGNDAALTLATNHPDGYDGFVNAMNAKAQELHLTNTTYRNPSGVENYNHLTTTRDLAILAAHISQIPLLSDITSTQSITVTDTSGTISHHLENTNKLLGSLDGVIGMKTGWTERAGECLVTYVEREGRGVITVVLGSQDRFGDTAKLIDWVYNHHTWVSVDN